MKYKYSFLLPYYDRIPQFESTLRSFIHHDYDKRDDFELVIVEDVKNFTNKQMHKELMDLVKASSMFPIQMLIGGGLDIHNPAQMINAAANVANGEYLILTNPECMHQTNILAGCDVQLWKQPDSYIVCACLSVLQKHMTIDEMLNAYGKWYQHSVIRNVQCHFCNIIHRDIFFRVGGFDEKYSQGMCFDDDDFRNKLMREKVQFVPKDDLVVLHLDHYRTKPKDYLKLHHINKKYFESVWGVDGLRAEHFPVAIYDECEVLPEK